MKTNLISHPRAITAVKDAIHGNIEITCFDREVIDSPLFQRLHFVLQNSVTYTAYPGNKNSRFVHSIGVADVAGRLLISALRHARRGELMEFLQAAERFIVDNSVAGDADPKQAERDKSELIEGWKATIAGYSGFSHSPFLKPLEQDGAPEENSKNLAELAAFPEEFIVETLWQACRICGLAHDVGHLPMSHSFEKAIERADIILELYEEVGAAEKRSAARALLKPLLKKKIEDEEVEGSGKKESTFAVRERTLIDEIVKCHGPLMQSAYGISPDSLRDFLSETIELHERRSLLIFQEIYDSDLFNFEPAEGETRGLGMRKYRVLVFQLAFLILYASCADKEDAEGKNPNSNVPPFLRVLKSIVAGEVDADRMDYTIRDGKACSSVIGSYDFERMIGNAVLKKHDDKFRIVYYERAISALEQYFVQRHDGYKYLIFHRTSSRSELCLQEFLGRLIHICLLHPASFVAEIFEDFGYASRRDGQVSELLPFDLHSLEALDDANLRTMQLKLRKEFKRRKAAHGDELTVGFDGIEPELIWPLQVLIDIVAVRDFRSILSPFKYVSIQRRFEKDLNCDWDEYASLLSDATSRLARESFLLMLNKNFSKVIPNAIVLLSVQKAKYFDSEKVEEPDWLYILEHSGDVVPITERSPLLDRMPSNSGSDAAISFHILKDDIKALGLTPKGLTIDEVAYQFASVLKESLDAHKGLAAPKAM